MQLKQIFGVVAMSIPLTVAAQNINLNNAHAPARATENMVLTPGVKVVNDSSVVDTKVQEALSSPAAAKLALAEVNTKINTLSAPAKPSASPYKKVPLLSDVAYFGKNHKQMLDYTRQYMKGQQKRLYNMTAADRGGRYFPIIDKIMDEQQMPRELKYLAVIESALNNNAVSPVGAVGPWQFMAATARHMGLAVNKRRDDRKDWYQSTKAACKYLNYLYDQFDDWLLVIAAYNSGPRPVINAISRTGKSDYWAIKKYLPRETQNHVLAFVATATIMEQLGAYLETGLPDDFNWASLNNNAAPSVAAPVNPLLVKFSEEELKTMAMVRIKSPIDLDLLSNLLLLDRRQIGRWNYDYYDFLDNFKPGSTYNLRIPKDKLDAFIEKKDYLERQTAKLHM